VTRGQQIEVAVRPVHDDALPCGRLAQLMFGEISREVCPPPAVRALKPKRRKSDEGGDDDDKARGLHAYDGTTRHSTPEYLDANHGGGHRTMTWSLFILG